MTCLKNLMQDARGAAAIEYGLLAALIAVGLIAVITLIGTDIGNTMNQASNSL